MADEWTPLDVDYFQHPKVVTAGRDAALLYLAGLCYCQRHLTDGYIPVAAVRVLAAEAWTKPSMAERLVDANLWQRTDAGFVVTGWVERNKPAEVVKAHRDKLAVRGAKANHKRWHVERGVVAIGCEWCDPSPTPQAIPSGIQQGSQDGPPQGILKESPPSPAPTEELLSSSTGLDRGDPQPGENEDRVAVAARRLGQLDHDQAEAAGKVRANPDGHLAACIRNRANDPQLNAIASANPNWTADQLVAAVTGELTRLELAKAAEATQAELDELRAIPADPATNVAGLAEARQARTKPRTA